MGFLQTPARTRIGLGLCVFGWIFNVIGFSTPGWLTTTSINQSNAYMFGLFHACPYSTGEHCVALPDKTPSWWTTAIQLYVAGLLLGAACVAVLSVYSSVKNDKKWLPKFGLVLALASATFIAAGAAVVGTRSTDITAEHFEKIQRTQFSISWSYAVFTLGVLQMMVGVLVA